MIINDTIEESRKATVCSENNDSIGTFRIKESAKAFSILSSSLYQNPIRSIIRELGCNARDAHVEAKNSDPWKLVLPTAMTPEFAVIDYGTGLSHQDVMKIYTTYFESTKTNSNEFVGALGLGSKSPFSYTDNFTISSVKDGVKCIYSTFLTEEQIPSIVLLDRSTTTERNGVEVRFSVKNQDFGKFRDEAIQALRFFDHFPIGYPGSRTNTVLIHGIEHIKTQSYGNEKPLVVMGGVPYTFDYSNKAFAQFSLFSENNPNSMIIRANIGDVDIQPSRESLTMTKKTIEFIVAAYTDAEAKIKFDIDKKLNEHAIEWDKICAEYALAFGGTPYESTLVKNRIHNRKKFSIPAKYSGRVYTSNIHKKKPGLSMPMSDGYSAIVAGNIEFVINDSKQTMVDIHSSSISRACGRTQHSTIVEFELIPGITAKDLQKELAKVLFGRIPVLTSELCADLIKKKKMIGIVYQIKHTGNKKSIRGYSLSRSSQDQFGEGSYYVELDKENNVVGPDGKIYDKFYPKLQFFNQENSSTKVFAIKHNSKFDRSLYLNFFDHMEKKNTDRIKTFKSDDFVFSNLTLDYTTRQSILNNMHRHRDILKQLDGLGAATLLEILKIRVSSIEMSDIRDIYPQLLTQFDKEIAIKKQIIEEFIKRTPLLWINTSLYGSQTETHKDITAFYKWKFANQIV